MLSCVSDKNGISQEAVSNSHISSNVQRRRFFLQRAISISMLLHQTSTQNIYELIPLLTSLESGKSRETVKFAAEEATVPW